MWYQCPLLQASLEQAQLRAIFSRGRWLKSRAIELPGLAALIEAEAMDRFLETHAQHLGIGAGAAHARAPLRLVDLALATLADERHDVAGLARVMRLEPLLEESGDLQGQAQEGIARRTRAARGRRFENALELCIVERGDHRRGEDGDGHFGGGEGGDGLEPALGRRRTRLELSCKAAIERRQRDRDARETIARQCAEK